MEADKHPLNLVEYAWNLKSLMVQNQLIMVYSDHITPKTYEFLMQLAEDRLDHYNTTLPNKKKILHILVEALQNIAKHGYKDSDDTVASLFVIGLNEDKNFFVLSGNNVTNSCEGILREKLDHLNSLEPDELREHYRHILENNVLSEKGGAGLGFIDMMRKAQSKMHYHFTRINSEQLFFTFKVHITSVPKV